MTTPLSPKIVFEDQWLTVIDKPTAMHSSDNAKRAEKSKGARAPEATLAHWLAEKYGASQRAVSENPLDAGLVQRLDFYTSGLIVAAKDRDTWLKLRSLIKAKKFNKIYHVILEGKLKTLQKIHVAIGNPNRSAQKVRVFDQFDIARTQEANTEITPLKYLHEITATFAKVEAIEGRRHQVRACAAYVSHPLVGDTLYGSKVHTGSVAQFWLHASELKFVHPHTQEVIEIKSDLPSDWPQI